MTGMKEFFDKKKLKNLLTPDFFLSLILLGVAIRFASEVPTWFDIPQSDDNKYIAGGMHFFEFLNGTRTGWAPDWSPLFQFWFFGIYRLVPDSTKIYYISMQLVGILIPFFAFLLLRRMQVTRWLAAVTAAFFLSSYAIWMAEPRVASFTSLVLVFLWWALSFLKERWQRLVGLTVSSLFLAYSRPEFFLMTIVLGLLVPTYLGFSLLKRRLTFHRGNFLFLVGSFGIILLFLIWWDVPFSVGRSIYAYGQHYARTIKNCNAAEASPDMAWEEILAQDFGDVQSIGDVIQENPLNFRNHIVCNIQIFPKRFLKVAFSSAWGSSWLFVRIWIAFVFFRLIVSWNVIKQRFIWLWEQDFLLLGLFTLGILMLDVFIIFPREHYLAIFSVTVWILAVGLFGELSKQNQKNWHQSITIGLCLLLLTPSMGGLFDYKIPQKPVLKTVETIRALELKEPIRLFATHPFKKNRSEIYFDENYYHIGYKPAEIPFDEYISTKQPTIIVITEGASELQKDPSWIAFEANPQEFGFHQIPFDEGDGWGPWRIYLKD
jgi:hypothetical protein